MWLTITPASLNPFLAFGSPIIPKKEKFSPGITTELFIILVAIFRLLSLLALEEWCTVCCCKSFVLLILVFTELTIGVIIGVGGVDLASGVYWMLYFFAPNILEFCLTLLLFANKFSIKLKLTIKHKSKITIIPTFRTFFP